MSNNYKGKNNNNRNGYKGKYYDPNYKANKAKYGDLYDPKDFAVLNPNWEPENNQKRNSNYNGRATNYKGPAHRYNPNYHNSEIMRKTRKRNKALFFVILILAILVVAAIKTSFGNDLLEELGVYSSPVSNDSSNSANTIAKTTHAIEDTAAHESVVPDINSLMSNTLITVDTCNLDGSREPNVMVDIGAGSRVYYGYTNEYSQLVYVQANSLQLQNSSTESLTSDGRYCEAQANVSGASGSYNRGHGIGDALGGVSNAYNIFPQLTNINSGSYNDIEIKLQDALYNGGSVTDFELKLTYPNSSSNIPSSYTMSYSLNGVYYEHTFNN